MQRQGHWEHDCKTAHFQPINLTWEEQDFLNLRHDYVTAPVLPRED